MKKLIVLLVVMMFGISAPAFAAKAVLSDSELGNINAGSWVGGDNNKKDKASVTDNTLQIKDTAQQYFVGVNNGNAVDSAIAMSTNVATQSQTVTTLSQTNLADITNNRPKNVSSEVSSKHSSLSVTCDKSITDTESTTGSLNANSNKGASLFGLVGGSDCVVTGSLDSSKDFSLSDTGSVEGSDCSSKTNNDSSAQAEDNSLELKDCSQTNVTDVGNLNAVASGAAMQVNVATSNSMSGSITQMNSATVVSGL